MLRTLNPKSVLAVLAMAAFVLVATPARAEEPVVTAQKSSPLHGGAGYAMVGVRHLDLSSLSSALTNAGYSAPGQTLLSLGGGGHFRFGRLLVGGEGAGLLSVGRAPTRGNESVSIGGGYGLARLGYVVFGTERLSVYPMIGVGGGGMGVRFSRGGDQGFGEVTGGARRDTDLSVGGLLLDASLGADYQIPIDRNETGVGVMLIGLRAGYTFAPIRSQWQADGGKISGGPDIGIGGPSVRLVIGFGGRDAVLRQ